MTFLSLSETVLFLFFYRFVRAFLKNKKSYLRNLIPVLFVHKYLKYFIKII